MPMELSEQRREGHLLFSLKKVGFQVADFSRLAKAVDRALADPPVSMAFEFRDSPVLDSACIGQLAKAVRAMGLAGKTVYCIAEDRVWEGLHTVGMETLLRRLPSAAEYWREVGAASA